MSVHKEVRKITTHVLLEMKRNKKKIAMLVITSYSIHYTKLYELAPGDHDLAQGLTRDVLHRDEGQLDAIAGPGTGLEDLRDAGVLKARNNFV